MAHRCVVFHPDSSTIEAWKRQLQSAGLNLMHTTLHYKDLYDVLAQTQFDVIFLTLSQDVEAGLEALQTIHQHHPKANLIVTSLHGPDRQTLKLCKQLNVIDFLVQPVSLDRLRQVLTTVKVPEEKRERGAVVCVGYTPTHAERSIISQMKLAYLYYPSCHLAIQMFQQRSQKRLIILIVQEDLEMYSSSITKPLDPLQALDESFMPPWKDVVKESQIYYQEYWRDGIIGGLLPQQIPCLYVPNKGGAPQFLPPDVIHSLKLEYVGTEQNFLQIIGPGESKTGAEEAVQKVTEGVNECLDQVEVKHPQLINPNLADQNEPVVKKKPMIQKKPIAQPHPSKKSQRMSRRQETED